MADFKWPPENTEPTADMPFYCSGEYSADPLNVSPEGNVYGQERAVVMDPRPWWWTGDKWIEIPTQKGALVPTGQVHRVQDLPAGPRPYREVWQVRYYNEDKNEYYWVEYHWHVTDEQWKPLTWLGPVDTASQLPTPGFFEGEAHWVINWHQKYRWVGTVWQKPRHSEMEDDEPHKHLPVGFIDLIKPDLEMVFVSPRQLTIEASGGAAGRIWINREWVKPGSAAAVFCTDPSLQLADDEIATAAVLPSTEYWVYLANSQFSQEERRGKLFVSLTDPENGLLARRGLGRDARLVGKVKTDTAGLFLKEQNISLVSRVPSLPEALRQQSDFVLDYVDEDNLVLRQLDDTHGEIAIASKLYTLDSDCVINRHDDWVEWGDALPERVRLHQDEPLTPNLVYYVYLPAEIDAYNFNPINPSTRRPWDETDEGAETGYDPELDYRLWPFLSPKEPEHGRLSEQAPGWYARHIGKVGTDANGRFIRTTDLSTVQQPPLNPTHFDGLAEIALVVQSSAELRIAKRQGTSGIVLVGGESVQTYEQDSASVHTIRTSDSVKAYTESNLTAPLSNLTSVSSYPGTNLYVYLADSRPCWGSLARRTFVSTAAPTNGYLSRNFPGNGARWLLTLRPDGSGLFTGSFVVESIAYLTVTLDDYATSLSTTWSSTKIQNMLDNLFATLNALIPKPGTVMDYAGPTPPVGWLVCNGAAVSRTAYAALFAAIGTYWGAGDGSTTFNVPNLCRKTTVGSGGTGTSTLGNAVGNTGGTETHTLTIAQMPAHRHGGATGGGNAYYGIASGGGNCLTTDAFAHITAPAHYHSIDYEGGSDPHNNVQPSAIMNKIIKY